MQYSERNLGTTPMSIDSIVTACNSSCGKVVFSEASVSHSVPGGDVGGGLCSHDLSDRGWVSLVPDAFWGGGYVWGWVGMSRAWITPPQDRGPRDTVCKRAVRILLE